MRFPSILFTLALSLALPSMGSAEAGPGAAPGGDMVRVPAGSYLPHYSRERARLSIESFRIDRHAVTQQDYLEFVTARPSWRKGRIKPIFAGDRYLADWKAELDFGGEARAKLPVTNVSWFAAKAYCEWAGKRLPTTHEWEYVAAASETSRDASGDAGFLQKLVELYTTRGGVRPVGSGFRNAFGVDDMHGVVAEWVLDFNNVEVSDDSRAAGGDHDRQLYCAAGGVVSTNPSNYPAFLRFAMRSGLEGSSTLGNLGFRCAGSA